MQPTPTFGDTLKRLRSRLDLTQEQLADRTGCAVQTIRTFERGVRRPSRAMAERLAEVLDVPPAERAGFVRLARSIEERPAAPPPAPPPSPRRTPILAPSLVGREAEQADLAERLRGHEQRLITIVGPGGMGKTSLALRVAADLAAEQAFVDGVAVAQLAPAQDVPAAAQAVATALDLALHSRDEAAGQIGAYLAGRDLLLLLDNLEHLNGDALAELLVALLLAAPGLTILATSRERLHLREEQVFELRGLGLPDAEVGPQVGRAAAVRLFVERAGRLSPRLDLTPDDMAAVARICRRLEGLPLAIELAAGWSPVLSAPEIAAEIERGIDALASGARDVPARHRSMRAALDHSWALLSAGERAALARLAIFRGGCDREAAAQVAGADLITLNALIDKSLLRRGEPPGRPARYVLHELVRQYAELQLDALGDRAAAEAAHVAHFVAFLRDGLDWSIVAAAGEQRAQLFREVDNLRAAWDRAAARGDAAALRAMHRGVWVVHDSASLLLDGAERFGRAAAAIAASDPGLAGQLRGRQAYFLARAGRLAAARPLIAAALGALQAHGETLGLGETSYTLGLVDFECGDYAAAQAGLEASLRITAAGGDHHIQHWALAILGYVEIFRGDYAAARGHVEAAVAAWRAHDVPRGRSFALALLGLIAMREGRAEAARPALWEALATAGATGDRWAAGHALHHLGLLALEQGDLAEAGELLAEAVESLRETGDAAVLGLALNSFGEAAHARGDLAAALRAYAEAAGLAQRSGAHFVAPAAALGLARLLDRRGQPAQALALARAVAAHPAADARSLAHARALAAELAHRHPGLSAEPPPGEPPLAEWAAAAAGLLGAG